MRPQRFRQGRTHLFGERYGRLCPARQTVDGVRVRRTRSVDIESRAVRLELTARRGEPLVPLAERVQEQVASALAAICGLDASRVDVTIDDLEDES